MLYVNRARLAHGLSNSPNVRVHVGFNDWRVGVQHLSLLPSSLWRGEGVDW